MVCVCVLFMCVWGSRVCCSLRVCVREAGWRRRDGFMLAAARRRGARHWPSRSCGALLKMETRRSDCQLALYTHTASGSLTMYHGLFSLSPSRSLYRLTANLTPHSGGMPGRRIVSAPRPLAPPRHEKRQVAPGRWGSAARAGHNNAPARSSKRRLFSLSASSDPSAAPHEGALCETRGGAGGRGERAPRGAFGPRLPPLKPQRAWEQQPRPRPPQRRPAGRC